MLWVALSLTNAFLDATNNVLNKKALNLKAPVSITVMLTRAVAMIVLVPWLFIGNLIPDNIFDSKILLLAVISSLVRWYNLWAFTTALKISEISLVVPLLNLTPVFMLVISPMLLGEFPSKIGLLSIGLIIIGSYILNMKNPKEGFLAPFRNLLKDRGAVLMLTVSLGASITANVDKLGIAQTNVIYWSVLLNLFVIIEFGAMYLLRPEPVNKQSLKLLFASGVIKTFSMLSFRYALTLTLAVYVVSIKRIASLFTVLYGYFLFGERHLKYRFIGAFLLVLAVILLGIFEK